MSSDLRPEKNVSHLEVAWAIGASVALIALGIVLLSQRNRVQQRWATFFSESPAEGSRVFRAKGCIRCHAVNGAGSTSAPDLGKNRSAQGGLPQLVAAMWDHAPGMWQRMNEKKIRKPRLDDREMAAIFAYVYMAQHVERPGDPTRGHELFESEGCTLCHTAAGGKREKGRLDLTAASDIDTPIDWTAAMWRHALKMQAQIQKKGLDWPEFQEHDLSDLYAYLRQVGGNRAGTVPDAPPDPERGWKLFQEKSCNACHAIKEEDGRAGPTLGPSSNLPPTFTQLAQLMVTKAPKMLRPMDEQGIAQPQLRGQDMTDLFAFLYSLRYVEPTGSAPVGKSLFSWRGCTRCHGVDARGGINGPALRGRGRHFSSISLAAALWRHGPNMDQRSKRMNVAWPTLLESDIDDLLAFLNSPVEQIKGSK